MLLAKELVVSSVVSWKNALEGITVKEDFSKFLTSVNPIHSAKLASSKVLIPPLALILIFSFFTKQPIPFSPKNLWAEKLIKSTLEKSILTLPILCVAST